MQLNFYQALQKSARSVCTGFLLLGSITAAAQTVPELMYFKFDGTGNSVLNEASSPVVPSGTLSGTMTQGGNAQFNGGLQGDGQRSFDGNFSTGWQTSLTGSWTFSMHVQNIQNQGFNGVNLIGSTSHNTPSIRMFTNGFTLSSLTLSLPQTSFANLAIPVTTGATFTVHVVHDASSQTISIYRNGVFEVAAPAPSNLTINAPTGAEMLVGGHIQSATAGRNINTGTSIDEFRLYNRALSASEIALTWNQELPLVSNCDIPGNLQVAPAGVEAIVTWTPGPTNNGYVLEYGPENFVPGTGTVVSGSLPANAPPITLTGLSQLTTYDYYLVEICNSSADTSLTLSGNFTTLEACPEPTQFAFNPPGGTEVSFSWNSLGTAFEVEYGIQGFTQGTGTIQSASGLADTITGLSQNTTYDVYLRQNCTGISQGFSTWAGPFTIITTCGAVSLPYIEDFNGSGWTVGTGATHTGSAIDNCWDRSPSSGFFWGPKELPTTTRNSGPNAAFRGANYMFAVANNGSTGSQAFLTSPNITIAGATDPVVRYYYHMFGNQMGTLVLEANDGSGWFGIDSISGQQQTTEFDAWRVREVSLSAITTSSVQLRFKAVRGNGVNSDMAIDALEVIDRGTCPTPIAVSPVGNQFGQIIVSWPSTGATSYDVQWGPASFFQGTGLNNTNTTDTFFVVNAPADNCYRFLVRSVCGASSGNYSRPIDVCLECLKVAPYLEDFNGFEWVSGTFFNNNGSEIDSCWQRTPIWQGSNVFFWGTRTGTTSTGNTGPNGDNSPGGTGKYVFAVGYGTGGHEAQFISPYIDMSALSRPGFRYFYHLAGAQIGSVRTEVQRLGETSWTIVDEIIGAQQTATTDPWLPRNIPIYDFAEDTVRIRLVAVRGAGAFNTGDHAIDDFEIFQDTSCTVPGNPQTLSVGADTAAITWVTNGVTDFQVLYSPAPFDPATANVVTATGNTLTLTGLDPETTYEVYLLALCDSNTISDTSQVLTFNTGCPSIYTAPFFNGFESGVWQTGTGSANANSVISTCWSRTATNSSYRFGTRVGETQSSFFPFTGPLGAYAGDKYIVARNSGISTQVGDFTTITTPLIDVSGLSLPAVEFYYHMHGADMGKLVVSYNDGGGWVAVDSLIGPQQFAQADPWLLRNIELPNLNSDTIQIRLEATLGGQYADIAFDNFEIKEGAACPAPFALSGTVIDPYSIELTWSEVNPTQIEIGYGPQGLIPTSPATTIVPAIGGAPFVLDSLAPNQCYDIFVRNNCTANGDSVSAWIGPISLCTPIDFDLENSAVIAPGAFCPDSAQAVSIIVTNNGFEPETGFDLGAEVFENGTLQSTLSNTFTGTLNPGETDTLLIGAINTSNGGSFTIRAFTDLTNDIDRFNDTIVRVLLVLNQNPVAITQSADTICSPGDVTFIKDPNFAAPVGWFDVNDNLLATGDSFTTGMLTSDTAFVARGLVTAGTVGPVDNTFGNNSGFFTQFATTAVAFTVNSWLTIDSVTIYPESPGLVSVALRTDPTDSLIDTRTIVVPASFTGGAFRAPLGFSLLPGNYRLAVDPVGTTVPGLGRTSTNAQYPYALNNDVIITGNTSNEPAIFYFFYNWRVTVGDICTRPDRALAVTLGAPPVASFSDDVATGTPGLTGFTVNVDASASTGATQYSWDFGDGTTATGMTFSHTYTSNGTYSITLVVSNPCGSDTLVRSVIIQGINVEARELMRELNVFPNPTTGNVTLSFDILAARDARLQIVNGLGEVIATEDWKQASGQQSIRYDLQHLPAGTYSIQLAVGEVMVVRKLVKL